MNGGPAARAAQIRIVAWRRTAGLPVPRWKVTRMRRLYLPGGSVTRGVSRRCSVRTVSALTCRPFTSTRTREIRVPSRLIRGARPRMHREMV